MNISYCQYLSLNENLHMHLFGWNYDIVGVHMIKKNFKGRGQFHKKIWSPNNITW